MQRVLSEVFGSYEALEPGWIEKARIGDGGNSKRPDSEVEDPTFFWRGARLTLRGRSMLPTLWPGIQIRLRDPQTIGQGDLVLYETQQGAVLHRVVAINGDRVQAQGDGVMGNPQVLKRSQVIACADGLALGLIQFWPSPYDSLCRRFYLRSLPVVREAYFSARRHGYSLRNAVDRVSRNRSKVGSWEVVSLAESNREVFYRYLSQRGVYTRAAARAFYDPANTNGPVSVCIAMQNGSVLGHTEVFEMVDHGTESTYLELMRLFVHRSARGAGIAGALVAHVHDEVYGGGRRLPLRLKVRTDNLVMHRVVSRFAYVVVQSTKDWVEVELLSANL